MTDLSGSIGTAHAATIHAATIHAGTVHAGTVHAGTVPARLTLPGIFASVNA